VFTLSKYKKAHVKNTRTEKNRLAEQKQHFSLPLLLKVMETGHTFKKKQRDYSMETKEFVLCSPGFMKLCKHFGMPRQMR